MKRPTAFASMIDHADLSGLLRDQPAPDRVALRPEVLALVVEALRVAVDDDAERDAVDARADPAVVERCARIDRNHVGLRRVADHVGADIDQVAQQDAGVESRAADQEVVGRPLALIVLPPRLAQPRAVALEAAGGEHAGARSVRAAVASDRGDEAAAIELEAFDRRVVADSMPSASALR
jgi:hypothetical protein